MAPRAIASERSWAALARLPIHRGQSMLSPSAIALESDSTLADSMVTPFATPQTPNG